MSSVPLELREAPEQACYSNFLELLSCMIKLDMKAVFKLKLSRALRKLMETSRIASQTRSIAGWSVTSKVKSLAIKRNVCSHSIQTPPLLQSKGIRRASEFIQSQHILLFNRSLISVMWEVPSRCTIAQRLQFWRFSHFRHRKET